MAGCELTALDDHLSHHIGEACLRIKQHKRKLSRWLERYRFLKVIIELQDPAKLKSMDLKIK